MICKLYLIIFESILYFSIRRIWDVRSGSEVKKMEFPTLPTSLDLSHDGKVFTLAYGTTTSFWDAET